MRKRLAAAVLWLIAAPLWASQVEVAPPAGPHRGSVPAVPLMSAPLAPARDMATPEIGGKDGVAGNSISAAAQTPAVRPGAVVSQAGAASVHRLGSPRDASISDDTPNEAASPGEAGLEDAAARAQAVFDGAAALERAADAGAGSIAGAVPASAPSRFEQRLQRVSRRATPVPTGRLDLANAPPLAGLRLAETALRAAPIPLIALASAALIVASGPVGVFAVGAAVYLAQRAFPAAMQTASGPRPDTKLPAAEAAALQARVERRLAAVLGDLSVPEWRRPQVWLFDSRGQPSAAAMGDEISRESWLLVGDGVAGVSDEHLDGIIAHELGHMHHGDLSKRTASWLGARVFAAWLTLAAVPVVAFAALTAGAWLLTAAGLAAAAGAVLASFAFARVMERRADLFAAWAAGRALPSYFERPAPAPPPDDSPPLSAREAVLDAILSLPIFSEHPRRAARARYMNRWLARQR